ncbi:hypothetical protein [Clostridium baratii]|uniref:hypothetical protein n=1 Tax=Clostridium baratii TaxID=1561 RepID=UPI0030D584DF
MFNNIINRLINKFVIKEYLYKAELKEKIILDNKSISLNTTTYKDIDYIKEYYSNEISDDKLKILKKRIDEEKVDLFSIKLNDVIVGYCSLSYKKMKENSIKNDILVNENQVYLFDDYIFKKYRGNRLHFYSIVIRLNYAIKNRKKEALVCVYSWNKSSYYNYEKIGFKKIKEYIYIKILNKLIENGK